MNKKVILFISTNAIWGGSESLWTKTALRLSGEYIVKAATYYDYEEIMDCIIDKNNFFDLNKQYRYPGIAGKIIPALTGKKVNPSDRLLKWMQEGADLVVICQGNNTIGSAIMAWCSKNQFAFATLTQLVTSISWPSLTDATILQMTEMYDRSKANFFVSTQNLALHETIFKGKTENNKIVFNPFVKSDAVNYPYPVPSDGIYKIAMIGRLEIFHKGYDLLFEIIRKNKWKNRSVTFSLFGAGPHRGLLERWKRLHQIDNITIKHHLENVADIWREHHILLMSSRMEGQSLTLIESMKFSRPSIVTRVGGVDELVADGHSGFVAPYATAEHLEEAMERAWDNRHRWQSMGEAACRVLAEKHPTDAISFFADQLSNIL